MAGWAHIDCQFQVERHQARGTQVSSPDPLVVHPMFPAASICLRIFFCDFSLLVLKGMDHCWKYFLFFSRGLVEGGMLGDLDGATILSLLFSYANPKRHLQTAHLKNFEGRIQRPDLLF